MVFVFLFLDAGGAFLAFRRQGGEDDVCLLFWSAGVIGFDQGMILMLIRAF